MHTVPDDGQTTDRRHYYDNSQTVT